MGRHTSALSGGFVEVSTNLQSDSFAVRSDVVSAGGHDWRVTCFPNDGDFVSVYLELMSEAKNVTAVFDAAIFTDSDASGASSSGLMRYRILHVYNNPSVDEDDDPLWGFPRFLEKGYDIPVDFHLSIMWAVVVLDDDGSGKTVSSIADVPEPPLPTSKRTIAVPPSDMADHLGRMLDTAASTDVSFVVENGQGGRAPPVHAHRALLAARSPVFEAALGDHMLEADAQSAPITVRDMEPDTFKAMLRFVYTDDLPAGVDGDEEILSLLAAADRYGLDRLKLLCAKRLLDNVSVGKVAGMLDCAETYNCPELKAQCIDYMVEDETFKKVALSEGFLELVERFPSILAEVRKRLGT